MVGGDWEGEKKKRMKIGREKTKRRAKAARRNTFIHTRLFEGELMAARTRSWPSLFFVHFHFVVVVVPLTTTTITQISLPVLLLTKYRHTKRRNGQQNS